jgi:hypothetical protein
VKKQGTGNREPRAIEWRTQSHQRRFLAALAEARQWRHSKARENLVLTAMGAVIAMVNPAMLVSPHDEINGAVHIYAGYLASRNLALAGMLLALLMIGARRALGNLVAIVGLIQFLDACMDVAEGRWTVAAGVVVFGVLFLFAATRFSGAAFWKVEAWK